MKKGLIPLVLVLIISMLAGCASNNTHSKSNNQKQTIEENGSKLSNDTESEDDDYDPKYTQVWRSKDKNISFKITSKYGFEDRCNIMGKFYGIDIEIDHSNWDPEGDYDGEMYFDRVTNKVNYLFSGGYYLSENKNLLTFIVRKVYKNKLDKHGIKKGDKIVFKKISGPKAQTHKNEENKADKDFTYTYNSKTKTLTFRGKGKIKEDYLINDAWTKIYKIKEPNHIVIGSGITGIGDFVFYAVDKKEKIGEDSIPKNHFSKIEDVSLPDTITNIGQCAFGDCKSLKSIKIPSKVKVISESAFSSCSSLRSVILGDNVEKIEAFAFDDCKKLESIKMPNSLKVIGYMSFKDCSELKTVELSDSTKSIAVDAFIGCEKLKEISVPKSVEKINTRAFGYITDKKKVNGFIVKGYKGTAAEKYAKENGFKFIALG